MTDGIRSRFGARLNDEVLMKDSASRIMSAFYEIGINEVLMALQEVNTLLELVEADYLF